jgi:hypothetical protein
MQSPLFDMTDGGGQRLGSPILIINRDAILLHVFIIS